MTKLRPLIAGNWKMNGLKASAGEFGQMIAGAGNVAQKADLLICPPVTLVTSFAAAAQGSPISDRRAGLPSQGVRSPYRRYFCRDAG